MKTHFLFASLLLIISCQRNENQSCSADNGKPLLRQPNSNAFELSEIAGTWRIDSLIQHTEDSSVTITAPFQAYHFMENGTFSFIDGDKKQLREHVYGKLILKGSEMYVVDQEVETSKDALYHWQILQLSSTTMKLNDFMVKIVSNVEGDLYLTKIPTLTTTKI